MNRQRLVTIVGAGRTGRGMLGEMFYSAGGFDLVFADNDAVLVQGLSKQGYYTVEQKDLLTGAITYTRVTDFTVIDTVKERDKYLQYLAKSEIIATALFPSAFAQVAQDIADMVKVRRQLNVDGPMAVLLGANYVGLYHYYHERIVDALQGDDLDYFKRNVALVTIKANRKIVYPDHFEDDKYFLTGDNKPVLLVDNNFLFPADYNYPSFFALTDDVELSMVEKIWSENLQHVTFSFVGKFCGYDTINEAVRDDYVRKSAYYAWKEGRQALLSEYGLPIPGDDAVRIVFEKFASPYFSDSLNRIGRQPIRKLKRNDRLVGPALLCLKHRIMPYFIARSIAYGFCYSDSGDSEAVQLEKIVHDEGIETAILRICELDIGNEQDNALYQLILASYRDISKQKIIPFD